MKLLLIVLALFVLSSLSQADDKPNCKLTMRTFKKDGSRKVKIDKIHTDSKVACKEEANSRKLTSDPDIDKIQVSYGWDE